MTMSCSYLPPTPLEYVIFDSSGNVKFVGAIFLRTLPIGRQNKNRNKMPKYSLKVEDHIQEIVKRTLLHVAL